MDTLTYGLKVPRNPNTGDVVFPALEADIEQLDAHSHDGTTSAPLSTRQITLIAANWVAVGGVSTLLRQVVTMPTGLDYDTTDIWVHRSTGERAWPALERISDTSFYVYTNNSAIGYVLSFR